MTRHTIGIGTCQYNLDNWRYTSDIRIQGVHELVWLDASQNLKSQKRGLSQIEEYLNILPISLWDTSANYNIKKIMMYEKNYMWLFDQSREKLCILISVAFKVEESFDLTDTGYILSIHKFDKVNILDKERKIALISSTPNICIEIGDYH